MHKNGGHDPDLRKSGHVPRSRSVPAAAAAETAAAARTVGLGLGFVDLQGAALEVLAVEGADGFSLLLLMSSDRGL